MTFRNTAYPKAPGDLPETKARQIMGCTIVFTAVRGTGPTTARVSGEITGPCATLNVYANAFDIAGTLLLGIEVAGVADDLLDGAVLETPSHMVFFDRDEGAGIESLTAESDDLAGIVRARKLQGECSPV